MRIGLIKLVLRLFAALPFRAAQAIGSAVGLCLAYLPNTLRRITLINLKLCLPEITEQERTRLARRSLIEVGKTLGETANLWMAGADTIHGLVKAKTGEEDARAAYERGRGLLVGIPHLGAWEFLGLYYSAMHYPLNVLYRPPRLPELQELVTLAREHLGAALVPATPSGIRSLYEALQRGEVVAILPDQEPGRGKGVFAPFFGIEANTMVLMSRLAQKSKAPAFFGYAERLPHGQGFHLHFHQASPAIASDDLRESATAVNALVEKCIRELPGQYQWGYKRFRTRPEGEKRIY